jgi:hypothetical protein
MRLGESSSQTRYTYREINKVSDETSRKELADIVKKCLIQNFVVADVVDHYPGLVEEIAERGHEIGCHGLQQKLTFVNFIDTDGRRLTQMWN